MTGRIFAGKTLTAAIVIAAAFAAPALAQKETIPGIRNFTKIDATVACAGNTEPSAMAELAKRGYKSVISLREPTETGAEIDASNQAAVAAGIKFIHLPFNSSSPDDATVGRFLAAIKDTSNQPVLVYCASGSRAGALWLVKRMLIDHWDEDKAVSEAVMIGMSSPSLKNYALDYVKRHK